MDATLILGDPDAILKVSLAAHLSHGPQVTTLAAIPDGVAGGLEDVGARVRARVSVRWRVGVRAGASVGFDHIRVFHSVHRLQSYWVVTPSGGRVFVKALTILTQKIIYLIINKSYCKKI